MIDAGGYSGTPLPQKLGIREHQRVALVNAPEQFELVLGALPDGAFVDRNQPGGADIVIWFVTQRADLEAGIDDLSRVIRPDRTLWVAWPKQASGFPTDIVEGSVRDAALPLGLVDTKVCAIDTFWSGLRLVWRRELR